MKEKILELRNNGKTYNEIREILNCSKSTISYYCGDNQKEKTRKRTQIRRENILIGKTENFKSVKPKRYVEESIRKFQKRDNRVKGNVNKNINTTFNWKDVIEKYGEDTYCYLSGEKLNLFENNYSLDHIIPTSKGGGNHFENLGISHKIVNTMKSDLTPEELISWCEKILTFNGYDVIKKNTGIVQ